MKLFLALGYNDAKVPAFTLGASYVQDAIDALKTKFGLGGVVLKQETIIPLASLQNLGALLTGTINVGSALPANARVLATEVEVTQALAGTLLTAATISLQATSETAGALQGSVSIRVVGTFSPAGSNPYPSRGGQQIQATFLLVGLFLNALTAGALKVRVFYSIIS